MIPDQARYAICLIAPAVLLVVRGAIVWSERSRAANAVVLAAGLTLGWFMLADCRQHYFRFIEETCGQSHRTFRTAAVEPKRAALDYILQHRVAGPHLDRGQRVLELLAAAIPGHGRKRGERNREQLAVDTPLSLWERGRG